MDNTRFQSVNTLFFDLGFTLINFEGDFFQAMADSYLALANSLVRSGCSFNPLEFSNRFNDVISEYYRSRESDQIERPVEAYLIQVLGEFDQPKLSDEIIKNSLRDMYKVTEASWNLELDTIPTLALLKESGYHLGLITNAANTENSNQLIDKNGLRGYFDVVLISAQEQIRKPDIRIFQRALFRMGIDPECAVMVGDKLIADIHGAQNAGMKGIWITRRSKRQIKVNEQNSIQPDAVIKSLSNLPDYFPGISSL